MSNKTNRCGKHHEPGSGRCMVCKEIYAKEYRAANKNKINATNRKWQESNKERFEKMKADWTAANKQKIAEQKKSYYQNNKERIAAREKEYRARTAERKLERDRKYRQENHEKIRAGWKAWRELNLERDRERVRIYNENNYEKLALAKRSYKELNKDKIRESNRLYYINNRETVQETNKRWLSKNKHKLAVYTAKRRSAKLNATPSWANEFFISEIYDLCRLRTKLTGIKHHVDHIIPLQSKYVCGLHTHDNLRVVTALENRQKGNRVYEY